MTSLAGRGLEARPRAARAAPIRPAEEGRRPRAVRSFHRSAQVLTGFTRFFVALVVEETLRRLPFVGVAGSGSGPARLRALLESLGGAFIKFGQLFSMRSDILPPDYCAALASLFDNVPAFPASEARAILERELGAPVDDLFASFDDRPVGAASFGQVHLVTLKGGADEGRRAVVKVCRPGSEHTIATDGRLLLLVGLLADALSLLGRIKLVPVFRDFVRWTKREINYLQEAKNADHLHELTAWNPRQRIPYIYWEKTTNRVLTMEYLEGFAVSDIIRRFEARDASLDDELAGLGCDRLTIARHVWQTFLLHAFVGQAFHGDPHPGNLIVLPENVIGLIDFGLLGRLNEEARREQALMLDAVARENIERLFVATLDVLDAPRGLLVTDTYDEFTETADAWLDACDNPGVPMTEKTLNRLVTAAMNIARTVGLVMATQTMLFYKGLLTVDSVVLRLYPEFDYKRETKRALRLIRMREIDRLYAPGNILDTALLTQLLVSNLPDLVAAQLQELDQGRKMIYRKLNRVPVVLAGLLKGAAWAAVALGLLIVADRFGYLRRAAAWPPAAPLVDLVDRLRGLVIVPFFLAALLGWMSRSMKAKSFSKVQREG